MLKSVTYLVGRRAIAAMTNKADYIGCAISKLFVVCCLTHTNTHTHIHLMALFPRLPGLAGTRKAKPIWILLKQETVSGGGISWATCKSAPSSRQITMPAPHHSIFFQAGCPSCRPTNSVKAPKARCVILLEVYFKYGH